MSFCPATQVSGPVLNLCDLSERIWSRGAIPGVPPDRFWAWGMGWYEGRDPLSRSCRYVLEDPRFLPS